MRQQRKVLALLRGIVEQVIEKPLGELAPETPIADLGIDSVLIAEIVARIEETLEIEVPASQWVRVRTLRDLVDAINEAAQE